MFDRFSTEGASLDLAINQILALVELQSPKDRDLARTVLIWLANVKRPLPIESLCEALVIDRTRLLLNRSALPTAESVTTCCQGLTEIDKHDSTVSLTYPAIEQNLRLRWPKDYDKIRADLSIGCLVYVSLATFEDGPSAHREVFLARFEEYPFLSYAADNWAVHAQETPSEEVSNLVMELFRQPNRLASAMQMKERKNLSATSDMIEFEAATQRVRSMSALQIAISLDFRNFVHILLEEQADVIKLDAQGCAILDEALRRDDLELFQILYEKALVNTLEVSGDLAIKVYPRVDDYRIRYRGVRQSDSVTATVEKNNPGALLALLNDGGNPNTMDERGVPALNLACQQNSADMVYALLSAGANINECDSQGRTALYEAVSRSDVDPNSDEAGDSMVLPKAATGNKLHLVRLLLLSKADPNAGDPECNPLSAAILQRDVNIVERLLEYGATTRVRMAGNTSPLHVAARLQDPSQADMVELLLRFGADVNSPDHSGRTPLFDTILNQNFDSTEMLLDDGADIEAAIVEDNKRPLHEAAIVGNAKIFQLLLKSSLCISPKDAHGMTPLDYAERNHHDDIVRLIKMKMP